MGALNAAIFSSGNIAFGEKYWFSISFTKVCKSNLKRVPILFLLPFHLVGMLLHKVPIPGALPFSSKLPPKDAMTRLAITLGFPFFLSLLFVVVVSIFSGEVRLTDMLESFYESVFPLYAFMAVMWSVPFIMRAKNYSLFNVTPLQSTLERFVQENSLKIPIYITLGRRKLCFDPDSPGFYHLGSEFFYTRRAMEEEVYIPFYTRLDKIETKSRCQALLASAAIPFGIFPEIDIDDEKFIDGGIVDNTPIYPLVSFEKCDLLFVVRLRPDETGYLKRLWQVVDRVNRVSKIPVEKCRMMYQAEMVKRRISKNVDDKISPPVNVPYVNPENWPRNIVVISPQKKLGGFLRGTMNFNSSYAKRIMKQGYNDAKIILDKVDMANNDIS